MKQVLVLLAILAFFVVAAALQAQSTCTLQGAVLDSNGEPIPGATVLVLGTSRGASTNADGKYVIQGLMPGSYQIRVTSLTHPDALTAIVVLQESVVSQGFEFDKSKEGVSSCGSLRGPNRQFTDPSTTGKITILRGADLLNR
ncbi:MAG: carboxypeptidase regulatory-like domain-containing protein [Ignavibacteriae bacterium]|nr:carboxypeptidase regulatory-like domain-containing protein [Ignavibacteriota bacterium]MCB9214538.1 carboxypeptidase regulatory-like domain-containing protein [Ignavibacteria bacterium]